MLTKEKNTKLNIHHQRNVTDVMVKVLNLVLALMNVLCVGDRARLGLIRVFSQFNKLVLNVVVQAKKFLILVRIVRV